MHKAINELSTVVIRAARVVAQATRINAVTAVFERTVASHATVWAKV